MSISKIIIQPNLFVLLIILKTGYTCDLFIVPHDGLERLGHKLLVTLTHVNSYKQWLHQQSLPFLSLEDKET